MSTNNTNNTLSIIESLKKINNKISTKEKKFEEENADFLVKLKKFKSQIAALKEDALELEADIETKGLSIIECLMNILRNTKNQRYNDIEELKHFGIICNIVKEDSDNRIYFDDFKRNFSFKELNKDYVVFKIVAADYEECYGSGTLSIPIKYFSIEDLDAWAEDLSKKFMDELKKQEVIDQHKELKAKQLRAEINEYKAKIEEIQKQIDQLEK